MNAMGLKDPFERRFIMTEKQAAKLASDLFDEGLRAEDADIVAEKNELSGADLEKITDLLEYYGSMEFYEH